MGVVRRRVLSISAVIIALPLLVISAPLWIVIGGTADLAGRLYRFPTLRLVTFGLVYVIHQWLGLLAAFALMITRPLRRTSDKAAHTRPYSRVQAWWVRSLFRWAGRLLGVRFDMPDPRQLPSGPFILVSRHASMVDAVLPAFVITDRLRRFVHYVLKRELRWDPSIDVFGHHLGNYFVTRSGDGGAEAEAIANFASTALPDSVLTIFPEGTYATNKTRARVLLSLERRGSVDMVAYARSLDHLLPPKPAGTLAMLETQPHLDVVVFGHVGLEGVAEFGGLRSRLPLEHPVTIRWWHHVRADIPFEPDAQIDWLNERWRTLDTWVDSVKTIRSEPRSVPGDLNADRSRGDSR